MSLSKEKSKWQTRYNTIRKKIVLKTNIYKLYKSKSQFFLETINHGRMTACHKGTPLFRKLWGSNSFSIMR